MLPDQIEQFITYFFEQHFVYTGGLKHVESRSFANAAVMKLEFHEGTDMGVALAETVAECNRSISYMPVGTRPPFVIRYDAGAAPVGYLLFSSETATVGQMQDAALNIVRPLFGALPGVQSPPPFGGSPRTVVITLKPDRLSAYDLSPDDIVAAVSLANMVTPAGQTHIEDKYPLVSLNSTVRDIQDLAAVPIRTGVYPTIFLRDVAKVEDSSDIVTCYALVNGRRTVYIPLIKRAEASTLSVVDTVKRNIPFFQSFLPEGIKVSFGFDQSPYVTHSINSLVIAGVFGALLAGLTILIFLRNWRGALIVILNVPVAILSAVFCLYLAGQIINLMTLAGLALAVGIVVNESTVCIENLHLHLDNGESLALGTLKSTNETIGPRLLSTLCILSMFTAAAFMHGAAKSLFLPLSLAVGFSIIASHLLSNTLLPVLSVWGLASSCRKPTDDTESDKQMFWAFKQRYTDFLRRVINVRCWVLGAYLTASLAIIIFVGGSLGTDIYPTVTARQLQIRLIAPAGTPIDATEKLTLRTLDIIKREVGEKNVDISVAFVGSSNPNYSASLIYLLMPGPEHSLLQVQLKPDAPVCIPELEERLRKILAKEMPRVIFSIERGDIVNQVMSLGAASPIEVATYGPNLDTDINVAKTIQEKISSIPGLRDIRIGQVLDYPVVDVNFDRERSGVIGAKMNDASKSLITAAWSSRYRFPLYWGDPHSDCTYQIQVQYPQNDLKLETIKNTQVSYGHCEDRKASLFRNLARFKPGMTREEYAHYDNQRMITVNANLASGADVGGIAKKVSKVVNKMSLPPRVSVFVRGQIVPLTDMLKGLRNGSIFALIIILVVLIAAFQSIRLPLVCLSIVPAVISGVVIALKLTETTLNIQSFSGSIMAVGVSMCNAILFVAFAERFRVAGWRKDKSGTVSSDEGKNVDDQSMVTSVNSALAGASLRLRPVLMTSLAMIAGIMPIALGFGEGGEQTAPLGRAIAGGLALGALATLLVEPCAFAIAQRIHGHSLSIDPYDPDSSLFISRTNTWN
jgi:multidrug efflux pump subunit AcrB